MSPASRTRSALAAGAVVAVAMTSAGCSGDDGADSNKVTIGVAAAASLTDVFTALADKYKEQHPDVDIHLDFGSSSSLAGQLPQRADVQIFASADRKAMETAVGNGSAHDPVKFAANHIVLAVPSGNPGHIEGLQDLADAQKRIALCDESVPCGRAAKKVLEDAKVTPSVDNYGSDVRAVLTALTSGEADAGMVYATDVRSSSGKAEEVRGDAHQQELENGPGATDYMLAPVGSGDDDAAKAADGFREFLRSEEGAKALRDAGFTV